MQHVGNANQIIIQIVAGIEYLCRLAAEEKPWTARRSCDAIRITR